MASLSPTEGIAFAGAVGAFTDANPFAPASDFAASINWGDGSSATAGTIAPNGAGGFQVSGAHAFTGAEERAKFVITIIVRDKGGSTVTMHGSATISDAPLAATGRFLALGRDGSFAGRVASFVDANPFAPVSDFSAKITWGDGEQSSGVIQTSPAGGFVVFGSHTYVAGPASLFHDQVQLLDKGGSVGGRHGFGRRSSRCSYRRRRGAIRQDDALGGRDDPRNGNGRPAGPVASPPPSSTLEIH